MASSSDDAPRIVDAILEHRRPDTPQGLYLGDLALHAQEFEDDVDIVNGIGPGFPCLRRDDGTIAPIDVGQSGENAFRYDFWPFRRMPLLPRTLEEDQQLVFLPPEQAKEHLRTGMVSFLASRIRSLRERLDPSIERVSLTLPNHHFLRVGAPTVSTTGFTVHVTASPNLRVHVSPTFRRSWRFFASPTSPAVGKLPGGIYEFAVDGGPYLTLTPDTGLFDIPYTTTTPGLAL